MKIREDQDNRIILNSSGGIITCSTAGTCWFHHRANLSSCKLIYDTSGLKIALAIEVRNTTNKDRTYIMAHNYDATTTNSSSPLLSLLTSDKAHPIYALNHTLDVREGWDETINFIHAFQHGRFIYLLSNYLGKKNNIRLGRICIDDPTFISYIELELQCSLVSEGSYHDYGATSAIFGHDYKGSWNTVGIIKQNDSFICVTLLSWKSNTYCVYLNFIDLNLNQSL